MEKLLENGDKWEIEIATNINSESLYRWDPVLTFQGIILSRMFYQKNVYTIITYHKKAAIIRKIIYVGSVLQNFHRFIVSGNLVYDYLLCFHNIFMILCGNWNIIWIIEKLSSCYRIAWRYLFLLRPKLLLAREKGLHCEVLKHG